MDDTPQSDEFWTVAQPEILTAALVRVLLEQHLDLVLGHTWQHGAGQDHEVITVLGPQRLTDLLASSQDVLRRKPAVFDAGRRHHYESDIRLEDSILAVIGRTEALSVFLDQPIEPRLIDWSQARGDALDSAAVFVNPDHPE